MIKPTIGRVVWYTPNNASDNEMSKGNDKLAAIVCNVWSDTCVNLSVFDANGKQFSRTSVLLIQDDTPVPGGGSYCEWMPFQKQQAAKHEQAEQVLRKFDKTEIARVCHEVNRAYCEALGDTSQVPWEQAPEWQKKSALLGVELHANNHEAGPQASHESWMAQKEADGWIYGPVKDPQKKEHPCMVPFSELPTDQQAKDFIFRGVVIALS